jgi:hypothetical protein
MLCVREAVDAYCSVGGLMVGVGRGGGGALPRVLAAAAKATVFDSSECAI